MIVRLISTERFLLATCVLLAVSAITVWLSQPMLLLGWGVGWLSYHFIFEP